MEKKSYQKSLDYIYSFIDYSLTRNLRYAEDKFDLSRMVALMDLLKNPQNGFDVIHVAGTKGKGSTCAMISSILISQGYSVGFYSSPHMVDFTERIRVNNQNIKPVEFSGLLNDMKEQIEKVINVSTFEITTALAFKYFFEKKVDIAVIEVGMGGRLDATNIVNPMLSVITSISLDHTKILGNSIAEIAKEKAGIIKKGVPVVIGKQPHEAKNVLLKMAKNKNCRVIDIAEDFKWEQLKFSLTGQEFQIIKTNGVDVDKMNCRIKTPLLGDHQLDNALIAFAVIENLPEKYKVKKRAIIKGFQNVKWPGRFEIVSEHPLVIVDGAHNPDSFMKLSKTIQKYLSDMKITLIFGVSEDKDLQKMIKTIQPFVDSIIFTKSDHPRAMERAEMEEKLRSILKSSFDFRDIKKIVKELKTDQDGVYIASGSLFVAGAIKQLIQ